MGGGEFLGVDQRWKVTAASHRAQSFMSGMKGFPRAMGFALLPHSELALLPCVLSHWGIAPGTVCIAGLVRAVPHYGTASCELRVSGWLSPAPGTTVEPWGHCWCTTSPSTSRMRTWSGGWRSCGTTLTATSSSCSWATRATCATSGLSPPTRPELSQVGNSGMSCCCPGICPAGLGRVWAGEENLRLVVSLCVTCHSQEADLVEHACCFKNQPEAPEHLKPDLFSWLGTVCLAETVPVTLGLSFWCVRSFAFSVPTDLQPYTGACGWTLSLNWLSDFCYVIKICEQYF